MTVAGTFIHHLDRTSEFAAITKWTPIKRLRSACKALVGRQDPFALEKQAYQRLLEQGFRPDAIIDVGSYHGEWTRLARGIFGTVPTMMIEAQPAKLPALQKVVASLPQTRAVTAVLSARDGECRTFYEMETGSSFLPERSNVGRVKRKVETRTLDSIAHDFPGHNIFLKIDVQGAELHVLAGAQDTLSRCTLVQLEIAIAHYNEGAPTMLQVLKYMDELSFAPFDVASESRLQGHLVQLDMLFTSKTSPHRRDFFEF